MSIVPRKTLCALCGSIFVIGSRPLSAGDTPLCPECLRFRHRTSPGAAAVTTLDLTQLKPRRPTPTDKPIPVLTCGGVCHVPLRGFLGGRRLSGP
jgi:hypothetical protein